MGYHVGSETHGKHSRLGGKGDLKTTAAVPEQKLDPEDGLLYSFVELSQKYKMDFSSAEISDYWKFDCKESASKVLPADKEVTPTTHNTNSERRLDPDDGQAYTLQEFESKHAGAFTTEELREFWFSECKPLHKLREAGTVIRQQGQR